MLIAMSAVHSVSALHFYSDFSDLKHPLDILWTYHSSHAAVDSRHARAHAPTAHARTLSWHVALQGPRMSVPYFVNPKLNFKFQGPEKKFPPVSGFDLLAKTGNAYEARRYDPQWQIVRVQMLMHMS